MAELVAESQAGPLSADKALELATLYRAEQDAQSAVRAALKASGMKFPNERDGALLANVVASAHFLFLLESMYTRVKVANLCNTWNTLAAEYGYPPITKPGELLRHLEAHCPAAQWTAGRDKYKNGQGAKYGDWKEGIANLTAVEAAVASGKPMKVKD